MTIRCPYCQKAIGLKDPRPGRFATKCPHCARKFPLAVPDDPAAEAVVTAVPAEHETIDAKVAGGLEETAAQGFALRDDPPPNNLPGTLGGYQVVKELGRGGMGAVYLARQLSLGRNVALKVMRPEWASNPSFVSRFTREAYAAAQLVHHNVVQIYDFGEDHGTSFFSMEFVQGKTLADLLREKSKLAPEVAVGYVLQAARGLKFAHDQSMIHRDIKPDNLLLNDQGIVKVADLGLVKTPTMVEAEIANEVGTAAVASPSRASLLAASSGPITQVNVALGTPAFMAPEQARDATAVDARADIYSLGCTLYDLVAGRPPFEGTTAYELITKHQNEPVVPPERHAPRVSKALSDIILKMIAKKPEDRYAHLGEVIKALEDSLGIATSGVFSPREEHANLLVECAERFRDAPTARLRAKVLLGAAGACALIVVLCLLARQYLIAGGFLGLGLMTALAYFAVRGNAEQSHLFLKTRELILGSGLNDWLLGLAGVALLGTLLVVFKLFWAWVAFGIVAVIIAVGLHRAIDQKAEAERREAVEQTGQMLRSMRLQGLDEDALLQFVCKYSGEDWEEFYETLFGYEAKLRARLRWGRGEHGRPRRKCAAWRDPLMRWIDAKQQARRAARDLTLLRKIEEKGLEAQGVNLVTARRKARRTADALVATAVALHEEARKHPAERAPNRPVGDAFRKAAAKPEDVLVEKESGKLGERDFGWLNLIFGPRPRFLLGAALVGGCLLWMHQNEIINPEQLKEAAAKAHAAAKEAAESGDVNALKVLKTEDVINKEALARLQHQPLHLPMVPGFLTKPFNGFNSGVAGLILLLSAFFRGGKIALFVLPGALLALLGPALGIPRIGTLAPQTISMAVGGILGVLGMVFGRSR